MYDSAVALSIKSAKADGLARELATLTGESITEAVVASLEARLAQLRRQRATRPLDDIVERFGALEVFDEREPDEILGFGVDGVAE